MRLKAQGRQGALLALAAGLISVYAVDRGLMTGLRERIARIRLQIPSEELALKRGLGIRQRQEALRQELQRDAGYFLDDVPTREVIATFLKETERIAQESGMTIVSLIPDHARSKGAGPPTYKAQLKAEGRFEQFVAFLAAVERSHRLISLEQFSLAPLDERATAVRVETTISMAVP